MTRFYSFLLALLLCINTLFAQNTFDWYRDLGEENQITHITAGANGAFYICFKTPYINPLPFTTEDKRWVPASEERMELSNPRYVTVLMSPDTLGEPAMQQIVSSRYTHHIRDIAIGADGSIWVGGSTYGGLMIGSDTLEAFLSLTYEQQTSEVGHSFVAKLDAQGKLVWFQIFPLPLNLFLSEKDGECTAALIPWMSNTNVISSAQLPPFSLHGSSLKRPGSGMFLTHFSGGGQIEWQKMFFFDTPMKYFGEDVTQLHTDVHGNIFLTGVTLGTLRQDTVEKYYEPSRLPLSRYLAKLSPEGDLIWQNNNLKPTKSTLHTGKQGQLFWESRITYDPYPNHTYSLSRLSESGATLWTIEDQMHRSAQIMADSIPYFYVNRVTNENYCPQPALVPSIEGRIFRADDPSAAVTPVFQVNQLELPGYPSPWSRWVSNGHDRAIMNILPHSELAIEDTIQRRDKKANTLACISYPFRPLRSAVIPDCFTRSSHNPYSYASLSPVPAQEYVQIEVAFDPFFAPEIEGTPIQVKLYDLSSRLHIATTLTAGPNSLAYTLPLEGILAGIYILEIEHSRGGRWAGKVIVQP